MAGKIGLCFLDDPQEKRNGGDSGQPRILSAEEKLAALKEVAAGRTRAAVAREHGVVGSSITRWVNRLKEAGTTSDEEALKALAARPPIRKTPVAGISPEVEEKILKLKKEHFEMGPAQIRAQLHRFDGIRVSVKPIRRVLKEAGYELEKRSKKDSSKDCTRFEMTHPNELWISDIFEFRIHKEKGYLVSFMDDFSRMIVGHRAGGSCTAQTVIELLDELIARHGKPERVLTDRGGQYASFKGMSVFQKHLEGLDIDHSMARSYHPQTCGKIEAFHRNLTRELMEMREFASLEEAAEAIAEYIRHFNTTRAHMGIGGLTPADRYFGRQEEVLEEIGRRCAERKSSSSDGHEETRQGNEPVEVLQMQLRGKTLVVSFCGKEFEIG